jgi:flagellar biosynthesis/type III secretory pathway M-ring protein FliF/YscJ
MIRALFSSLIRLLIWFFAFYVVMAIVRSVVRAFSPRPGSSDEPAGTDKPVGGRPEGKPVNYGDVKDATFSDVPEKPSDSRPS